MKKVLLSENKEQALQFIENLNKIAGSLNDLIRAYNELPALDELTRPENIRAFLKNSRKYLDNAILNETGLSYGKIKPEPAKVAELYGIPRSEFLRMAESMNGELEFLSIDENKLSVEFDRSREVEIYESFKEFSRTEAEAEEIEKCREMCEKLNQWLARYNIHPSSINLIADHAGLKCRLGPDGHTWLLTENITFIRNKLHYEQIHAKNSES
jgi:hypothetical protein